MAKKFLKKAQNGALTKPELDALAHQKRGMGTIDRTFVKKSGGVKNETGTLTEAQRSQLEKSMSKTGTAKKIYEGLPNVGRIIGRSASDIPKGSQLEKQKMGGKVAKKVVAKKVVAKKKK